MHGRNAWGVAGAAAAALVALAVLVAGATRDARGGATSPSASVALPIAQPERAGGSGARDVNGASALQDAFVDVVRRVRPSVVEISTAQGLGSGVVYDTKGDIVTNAHVVGSSRTFTVTTIEGKSMTGTLVGTYVPDDLAVIRVPAGDDLPPASFADSSHVEVGDVVLAIGNPLGLASSVTEGIVSSTARTVSEGNGVVLASTIQTSAAINPGNSGGGLVGLDGDVVGIPTLAAVDPELGGSAAGIGFAIPSNTVRSIAAQLIAQGRVTNSGRAALGIRATTAESLDGQPIGVLVRSASPPASGAGIRAGDVIVAVNGQPTPTLDDLQTLLAQLAPGRRVTVEVTRPGGTTRTVHVVLGSL